MVRLRRFPAWCSATVSFQFIIFPAPFSNPFSVDTEVLRCFCEHKPRSSTHLHATYVHVHELQTTNWLQHPAGGGGCSSEQGVTAMQEKMGTRLCRKYMFSSDQLAVNVYLACNDHETTIVQKRNAKGMENGNAIRRTRFFLVSFLHHTIFHTCVFFHTFSVCLLQEPREIAECPSHSHP